MALFKCLTLAVVAASMLVSPSRAETEKTLPEILQEEFERGADEFGQEAQRAVETLLPMLETLMNRLPILIDNLPEYELPKIMPNGDIIIRRKRAAPKIDPDVDPMPDSGIKT